MKNLKKFSWVLVALCTLLVFAILYWGMHIRLWISATIPLVLFGMYIAMIEEKRMMMNIKKSFNNGCYTSFIDDSYERILALGGDMGMFLFKTNLEDLFVVDTNKNTVKYNPDLIKKLFVRIKKYLSLQTKENEINRAMRCISTFMDKVQKKVLEKTSDENFHAFINSIEEYKFLMQEKKSYDEKITKKEEEDKQKAEVLKKENEVLRKENSEKAIELFRNGIFNEFVCSWYFFTFPWQEYLPKADVKSLVEVSTIKNEARWNGDLIKKLFDYLDQYTSVIFNDQELQEVVIFMEKFQTEILDKTSYMPLHKQMKENTKYFDIKNRLQLNKEEKVA